MPVRAWFPTLIYCGRLQKSGLARLNRELADECRKLRAFDRAGRRWSEKNYPGGYTSYASMNELHRFSSTFADLAQKLTRHTRTFARALELDLRGRTIQLTDLWVNIMPPSAAHSLHLHPLSFISGTYYVATPRGCPGLKFEDPRLDRFMAAPPRRPDARRENQPHITYPAEAGNVILFESWLRHEVAANRVADERISISFNFNWA
jgi:uncharacterized protein (TIGR02466 family)